METTADLRLPSINGNNTVLSLPPTLTQGALVAVSRDRTPTQSLYVPEALSGSIPATYNAEDVSLSSTEACSLPSMTSFELDTPDQTFSSEAETAAASEPAISDIPLEGRVIVGVISNNDDTKDLEPVIL